MVSGELICSIIALSLTILIFLPFVCYCVCKLEQVKQELYVQNRFRKLVYLIIFWVEISILVYDVPLMIGIIINNTSLNNNIFLSIFYHFVSLMCSLLLLIKCWLTIFKFKHQNAIIKHKWMSIINSDGKPNFWIKYKTTLGRSKHSQQTNNDTILMYNMYTLYRFF